MPDPYNALAGEVKIGHRSSVWYNSVIRGDLNAVNIGALVSIGDHTTIHTVASTGIGVPASTDIGNFAIIGSHCSLCSCTIGKECYIGPGSTILEGARLEEGSMIAPNSVVPPGRLIPSGEVWGGNPVEYIRTINDAERMANYSFSYSHADMGQDHKRVYEFTPNGYLLKVVTKEEYDVPPNLYTFYNGLSPELVLNSRMP